MKRQPATGPSTGPALQREARALGDPTRHAIFRYVADATEAATVAELTAHFELNHNAIRQHLAKLVEAELLVETTAHDGGPGRPRLLYALAPAVESRWGVAGPYERLSLLLAEVIRTGTPPIEVGRQAGRNLAVPSHGDTDDVTALADAMARQGFTPDVRQTRAGTEVVLGSCPFATTAVADPDTVCGMHLGIAEGLAEGTDLIIDELVRKDPRRAGCRLRVHSESDE